MSDHPRSNESWLEFFRRTRRFSDLILSAWSQIEFNIDQLVARQYDLLRYLPNDKRIRFILDNSFQRKLELLKDRHVITNKEASVIKKFQEYRNRLFHGKESFFMLPSEEEDEIMDNAIEAARITLEKLASPP